MADNTYRVFIMNIAGDAATAQVAYVRGVKYDAAWGGARAVCARDEERQEKWGVPALYNEPACVNVAQIAKRAVVAAIDEVKTRNVKLDKAALLAIANDETKPEAERLAALTAALA